MKELIEKYKEYQDYLYSNHKSFDEYLNLKDFMTWLQDYHVSK